MQIDSLLEASRRISVAIDVLQALAGGDKSKGDEQCAREEIEAAIVELKKEIP